jgi:hypothetical protein
MKKLLSILAFAHLLIALQAQPTNAPRYVLAEHFTNSRCSICASKNPAFYNTLAANSTQMHHISIHPSTPYATCLLYLENTTDNSARASQYGIAGTPRVALNGTLLEASSPMLPVASLTPYLNQTSPINIQVTESGTTATVKVQSFATPPTGTYVLHAALVEKEVNYNSPNGESIHRDVLRDMLTVNTGEAITLPASGQNVQRTFTKTTDPDWISGQLYVVAWIENTATKEVLNSGTKFDPIVSSVNESRVQSVAIVPNPASYQATLTLPGQEIAEQVRVLSADGREVRTPVLIEGSVIQLTTVDLPAGWYIVEVRTADRVFIGRLVR